MILPYTRRLGKLFTIYLCLNGCQISTSSLLRRLVAYCIKIITSIVIVSHAIIATLQLIKEDKPFVSLYEVSFSAFYLFIFLFLKEINNKTLLQLSWILSKLTPKKRVTFKKVLYFLTIATFVAYLICFTCAFFLAFDYDRREIFWRFFKNNKIQQINWVYIIFSFLVRTALTHSTLAFLTIILLFLVNLIGLANLKLQTLVFYINRLKPGNMIEDIYFTQWYSIVLKEKEFIKTFRGSIVMLILNLFLSICLSLYYTTTDYYNSVYSIVLDFNLEIYFAICLLVIIVLNHYLNRKLEKSGWNYSNKGFK